MEKVLSRMRNRMDAKGWGAPTVMEARCENANTGFSSNLGDSGIFRLYRAPLKIEAISVIQ